jgi:ATP-dependent Clp protease ATP-binding subunit ClpA
MTVSIEDLARVIELWTKIPASKITESEYKRIDELETRLKSHVIGQDAAIAAVAAAIKRSRAGISPKKKPISFIFAGPTGVGKTELVKRLALDLFNSPESLIRIDMSEFMEKHSVSRIVGAPPGYVGYDEAGQLTEKIRRKPYSVILFDEIEKAHPDVLNILLQILDDGHITDAHGKYVSFENTVIVMTTNAGSNIGGGTAGFGNSVNQQSAAKTKKALEDIMRPEFLNRVDEIITFNSLSIDNFKDITKLMLDELKDSLAEKQITFAYDDAVAEYLTKKSYSIKYGARNLRRLIQKEIEDAAASIIISRYEQPVTALSVTSNGEKIDITAI